MTRSLLAGLGLVLLSTLVSGCMTPGEHKRANAFSDTTRLYEAVLRWGDIREAYGFLRPDKLGNLHIPRQLEHLKVTGYEVISAPAQVSEQLIAQTVIIQYLHQERQIEKQLTDQQLWEFDPPSGRWYLISDIAPFDVPRMRTLPLNN